MDDENKEYDVWNTLKKVIQSNSHQTDYFPQEGEVWMGVLGKNIGREQNGGGDNFSRALLIVKKFNNEIFWILPLSTKQKKINYYYNFVDENDKKVSVILAQIRLVHIKRFKRKLYNLSHQDMSEIKKKLREYFL